MKDTEEVGPLRSSGARAVSPAPTCWVRISPLVYTMLASLQPYRSKFSRKLQRDSSKLCQGGKNNITTTESSKSSVQGGKALVRKQGPLLRPVASLWEPEQGREMGTSLTQKSQCSPAPGKCDHQ